jgi:hypothetical protein
MSTADELMELKKRLDDGSLAPEKYDEQKKALIENLTQDFSNSHEIHVAQQTHSNIPPIRGSQYRLQQIINSNERIDLDKQIGLGPIEWLSPLAGDDNHEYQLNRPEGKALCEKLGLPTCDDAFWDFWPKTGRGPVWDAIGLTRDGSTIVLVEAKSYVGETNSKLGATATDSINSITTALEETFHTFPGGTFDKWLYGNYQMANRLTFLKKLNDISAQTGKLVKLVYLNFENDPKNPTNSKAWDKHYKTIFNEMTGISNTPENVILLNFKDKNGETNLFNTIFKSTKHKLIGIVIVCIAIPLIAVTVKITSPEYQLAKNLESLQFINAKLETVFALSDGDIGAFTMVMYSDLARDPEKYTNTPVVTYGTVAKLNKNGCKIWDETNAEKDKITIHFKTDKKEYSTYTASGEHIIDGDKVFVCGIFTGIEHGKPAISVVSSGSFFLAP